MILGTIVADAEERSRAGEQPLFFCSLNSRDFEPTAGNNLGDEYRRAGLTYLPSFAVP